MRRLFEPFGQVLNDLDTESTPRLFTNQPFEESSGLYDFGARWYDAEAGRFTGVDPVVQEATAPQTLNGYTYVGNNPLTNVDPDGRFFGAALGFALGIAALFGAFGSGNSEASDDGLSAKDLADAVLGRGEFRNKASGLKARLAFNNPSSIALQAANVISTPAQISAFEQAGVIPGFAGLSISQVSKTTGSGFAGTSLDTVTASLAQFASNAQPGTAEFRALTQAQLQVQQSTSHHAGFSIPHTIDVAKQNAVPFIAIGSGTSKVTLGFLILGGLVVGGPTGVGAGITGFLLIGTGALEIDAGLAIFNQVFGTNVRIGPFSRGTARGK